MPSVAPGHMRWSFLVFSSAVKNSGFNDKLKCGGGFLNENITWVHSGALNKWDLVFRHVVFSIIHICHVYPWKNCDGEQCLAAGAAWFKFALARNPKVLFWPRRTRTWRHASWFALPTERVMCEFPETICHRQKHLWDFKHVNMTEHLPLFGTIFPYFASNVTAWRSTWLQTETTPFCCTTEG